MQLSPPQTEARNQNKKSRNQITRQSSHRTPPRIARTRAFIGPGPPPLRERSTNKQRPELLMKEGGGEEEEAVVWDKTSPDTSGRSKEFPPPNVSPSLSELKCPLGKYGEEIGGKEKRLFLTCCPPAVLLLGSHLEKDFGPTFFVLIALPPTWSLSFISLNCKLTK